MPQPESGAGGWGLIAEGTGPEGTAFALRGPERGSPVVLIHGLGLNRELWAETLPALAGFRVLTYDLLGHGQTPTRRPAPVLADLTAQLADLMDHLGMARAALVGFSLGGMVARHVAQTHPGRVTALALLNTPYTRSPEAQAAVEARVAEARDMGPAATVDAALERWFSGDWLAANPERADLVRRWVLANDAETYPGYYHIFAEDLPQVIRPTPPLTCPTLVITADQDHGNSPAMARAIAADIPGAEVLILSGLRHMALFQDPESVNTPLAAFLSRHLEP